MTLIPLSRASLSRLPPDLAPPSFDLAAVRPGIVHLGLGGFHRAHMARYTHDLMAASDATAWGIVGAGLLAADGALQASLGAQDRLFTLIERDGDGEAATVIGALAGLAHGGSAALAAIQAPEVRIVSLTVTSHGYGLDPATGMLDPAHPAIAADLAAPRAPSSAVGVVVEGQRRRRAAGRPAFTAMSCDNLQGNGQVLKGAVLAYADLVDPALAAWIDAHGAFPSTMVDRITPAPTAADVRHMADRYGVADQAPVVSERFIQWVIEDHFVDGRPDWDAVGAQFVADVAPYELMKLRLLNASHLAVAGVGRLMGYRFIHEAIGDTKIRRLMQRLMDEETGPTLLQVPGVDLAAYKATLIQRFANPAIRDTVDRVNADAPVGYLLDPIRDRLREGASIDQLALAVAAWMRRVRGVDETGAPIEVRHPLAAELRARAIEGGPDPRPLLALSALFGDLGRDPRLEAATGKWLRALYQSGAAATLDLLS